MPVHTRFAPFRALHCSDWVLNNDSKAHKKKCLRNKLPNSWGVYATFFLLRFVALISKRRAAAAAAIDDATFNSYFKITQLSLIRLSPAHAPLPSHAISAARYSIASQWLSAIMIAKQSLQCNNKASNEHIKVSKKNGFFTIFLLFLSLSLSAAHT